MVTRRRPRRRRPRRDDRPQRRSRRQRPASRSRGRHPPLKWNFVARLCARRVRAFTYAVAIPIRANTITWSGGVVCRTRRPARRPRTSTTTRDPRPFDEQALLDGAIVEGMLHGAVAQAGQGRLQRGHAFVDRRGSSRSSKSTDDAGLRTRRPPPGTINAPGHPSTARSTTSSSRRVPLGPLPARPRPTTRGRRPRSPAPSAEPPPNSPTAPGTPQPAGSPVHHASWSRTTAPTTSPGISRRSSAPGTSCRPTRTRELDVLDRGRATTTKARLPGRRAGPLQRLRSAQRDPARPATAGFVPRPRSIDSTTPGTTQIEHDGCQTAPPRPRHLRLRHKTATGAHHRQAGRGDTARR